LFDLAENKTISVAEMFSLGVEQGGEGWSWRRRLWVWEDELLEELRALLLDVSLLYNVSDRWVCLPDPMGGYVVRGAYDLLTEGVNPLMDDALELAWHHQVPLKVSIFA